MLYLGNAGGPTQILYCESDNGLNWSHFQLAVSIGSEPNNYDQNQCEHPMVINENGVGRMWYQGTDGGAVTRILYCESR